MNDQTDNRTLSRLGAQLPAIWIYMEIPRVASGFTFPPGNRIAMELFAELLKSALEFDQVELLGAFWGGDFNRGAYCFFVEPTKIGMAALILKGVVETRTPFAFHLVEIVDRGGATSMVISQFGERWGTAEERLGNLILWSEDSARAALEDQKRLQAVEAEMTARAEEVMRRLDELERRVRGDFEAGEEWKKSSDDADSQGESEK